MEVINGLDLFAGIGGITLGIQRAAARAGLEYRVLAYCEIDRFCQGVLQARIADGDIPDAPIWDDIRNFPVEPFADRVDIITGGFPCQDISQGNRAGAGLKGARSGLFYDLWNIVRRVRPALTFLENVPEIVTKGLPEITAEMASSGHTCEWDNYSARAVGALHLRKRWFGLAYSDRVGGHSATLLKRINYQNGPKTLSPEYSSQPFWDKSLGDIDLFERTHYGYPKNLGMVDGLPEGLDIVRAAGNAVVPQVVERIWDGVFQQLKGEQT